MGCTVCGSQVPCGCVSGGCPGTPVQVQSVPCPSPCTPVGTCCSSTTPATPQPFYNCAPSCAQEHMQKIVIQQFSAVLKIVSSWNVPECGMTAIVSIPGLKDIQAGAYLWNPEFGYFEISAFDVTTSLVTLINHCNEENAAAGTNVPACTEFIITDPPVVVPSGNVCVAIDFTAPAVGDCLDITLTSLEGIGVTDIVQIGTGLYLIDEVKPNNIVTICNEGDGITPGTPVIALDANGNFQYCLSVIASNPCTKPPVQQGALLICDRESGGTTTLQGAHIGFIPVLKTVGALQEAEYRPLQGDPQICTNLAANLSIILGQATYTIVVDSTANFAVDDILVIGDDPGRFTVDTVVDATHLDVTVAPTPGTSYTLPVDTIVCTIGCCERAQNGLDSLYGQNGSDSTFQGAGTVNTGAPTMTTSMVTLALPNPSVLYTAIVEYVIQSTLTGTAINANLQKANYEHKIYFSENNPAPPAFVSYAHQKFAYDDTATPISHPVTHVQTQIILPGQTLTLRAIGEVNWLAGNAGLTNVGISIGLQASVIAVQL